LTLASKLAEKNSPFVLIIICPFINLCQQWLRELATFGVSAVPCFRGLKHWVGLLEEGYQRISAGLSKIHVLVSTNSTFISEGFQARMRSRLATSSLHYFLIADEVHNLGAERIRKVLPEKIVLRLGLSATPERYLDPVGTDAVLEYFGSPVYEYSIAHAIADGHLCRYRYHPILVQLTDEEAEEYLDITTKLAKFFPSGDVEGEIQQIAMRLLMKRARLLAGATQKIIKLDELIQSLSCLPKKAIFYCGDGRTTDIIQKDEVRQIKAVSRLLGTKHGMKIRNFTSREKSQDREEILRDFESGFLDAIVAIRCLDEGIDLPDLRVGFLLASSTNPRQFIQRRGRLLRNAPGKNRADIYDFIIEPPNLGGEIDDDAFNLERSFFQRELKRIVEFCRTAENGPTALNSLKSLRINYNLLSE
jgi:superfamily II DNA or RNA helicase